MLEQKPNTISKFDVQLSKDLSICQNSSFVNGTKMRQLYDNELFLTEITQFIIICKVFLLNHNLKKNM